MSDDICQQPNSSQAEPNACYGPDDSVPPSAGFVVTPVTPPSWVDNPVDIPPVSPEPPPVQVPPAEPIPPPVEPFPPVDPVPPVLDVPPLLEPIPWLIPLWVLLWPNETAPPWMDEMNPVTGKPYTSKEEYDQLHRLSQDEITRRAAEYRKQQLDQADKAAQDIAPESTAGPVQPCPSQSSSTEPVPAPQTPTEDRKYPNQTCDDATLQRLHREIGRRCKTLPMSCSDKAEAGGQFSCDELRDRWQRAQDCLNARQKHADECFGGKPDQNHQDEIDKVNAVLSQCLAKLQDPARKCF